MLRRGKSGGWVTEQLAAAGICVAEWIRMGSLPGLTAPGKEEDKDSKTMGEGAGSSSADLTVRGEHTQGRREPEKGGTDLPSCRRSPRIRGAGCRPWAGADR